MCFNNSNKNVNKVMQKKQSKKIIDLSKSKKAKLTKNFCDELKNKVKSINLKNKENERRK